MNFWQTSSVFYVILDLLGKLKLTSWAGQKGSIMVILESYDPDSPAIIDPAESFPPFPDFPDVSVSCFTADVFRILLTEICGNAGKPTVITPGMGRPVYISSYKGKKLALYLSPVGAPACAAALEDIYAMGVNKAIVFGTCGVLDRKIPDGSVILPDSAVRDEGTSFHYAPPSDEIEIHSGFRSLFESMLVQNNIPYRIGKVWTTDAVYRETHNLVKKRRQQDCICVDMECSALAAVAQFRNKEYFPFFYAADNLDSDTWDPRSLSSGKRRSRKSKIAELAANLAAAIAD